jgi:hypothetical protein
MARVEVNAADGRCLGIRFALPTIKPPIGAMPVEL